MDTLKNILSYEEVILVDTNDRVVGTMEKQAAHEQAKLHRAFSVFLFNEKKEMLLQQRAFGKYHSPGLWSNTCCSHPRPGELTEDAARRRLKEEMGIDSTFHKLFSFIYKAELGRGMYEYEFDHVYAGSFSGEPEVNHDEVAAWKYMHLDEIIEDIKLNPEQYTYWFRMVFDKVAALYK